MRPTNVCLLVMQLLFVLTNVAISQVNLTNANPSVIIDFSAATPATVGSNPASAFTGAGFEPGPASAGKLSSSAWAITGWSIGDLTFNGSRTTDDYARGATSSAITTGGIYAYTGAPGTVANPAIMFQPGSTDFTPGTITLQIQNQGSSNITSLNISYNIFIRNNEGWSNSFNFAHSANNTSFTSVDAVNYASPEAADAAGWVLVGSAPSRSTIINGLNIAPGAVYYLRWLSDDVFGSGSRDEFGLDDISVAATFSPTTWFVNDNSTTDDVYTTSTGSDANAGTASSPFATLSYALSVASAGDIIKVDAGLYTISSTIDINKAIAIKGVFAGVQGTPASRGTESILNDGRSAATNPGAFSISTSSPIEIDGFTFTGSRIVSGQPANANLQIRNNRFMLTAMPNANQTNMIFAAGCNITLTGNFIRTNGFNPTNSAVMQVAGGYAGSGSSDIMTITNNIFRGIASPAPYNNGNGQSTLQLNFSNVQGIVSGNTFDGVDIGIIVANNSGNLAIQNNVFTDIRRDASQDIPQGFYGAGILLFSPSYSGPVTISGNTFQNSDCGIRSANAGGTESGTNISISNNTFLTNLYDIVHRYPTGTLTLNSNNIFSGTSVAASSLTQLLAIEDKIVHKVDVASYGFVDIKAGNVFVTTFSFFTPGLTTTASIQRGVNVANNGDAIHVGPGVYGTPAGPEGAISVSKDNINLKSTDGAATTIIQGQGAPGGSGNALVYLNGSGNSFDGFTVDVSANTQANATEQHPLRISGDNNIVNNNIIIGKGGSQNGYGVMVSFVNNTGLVVPNANNSADNNQVMNNVVHDFLNGGILIGGSLLADQNVVSGNEVYNTVAGVFIDRANNTSINENIVYNNERYGIRVDGAIARPSSGTIISRNVVRNNGGLNIFNLGTSGTNDLGAGIYLNGASADVQNNFIRDNKRVNGSNEKAGILISNSTDGLISNPVITFNSLTGNDRSIFNANAGVGGMETILTSIGRTSTSSINAPCNWFGTVASGAIASSIAGNVIYSPYLLDGTDDQPSTPGFQTSASCGTINNLYVNDNNTTGDQYTTAVGDDNNPGTASAPFATIAKAVASASAGNTIYVDAGSYDEQVVVNKGVTIQGSTTSQSILSFNGTVAGKPTLFDISADGVTVDHMHFYVDLSKLKSAIIASAVGLDNIVITNNFIRGQGTPSSGTYGDRNAVSVNYGGNTNYRVASGGVNSVIFTGNTVAGTAPSSYFRSGISVDEGGGVFSNNILQTINHDVLVRFANNGNVTISNNQFQGGGVELAEHNSGSGTFSISNNSFVGPFANSSAPGTAVLRIKNNNQMKPTMVGGNTFTDNEWAVSIENYNSITLDNNSFTPLAGSTTFRHVVFNTKAITTVSNSTAQTTSGGTFTNNTFNGSGSLGGTAISFLNHDNDNATFGTFVLGSAGNENNFNGDLAHVIYLDGQTGASSGATFPNYTSLIGAGAGAITTMACWPSNIDATNNLFNGVSGATATLDQNFALEDKIMHKTDNSCLGFVRVKPAEVFVTINSGSIQRGIDAASSGDKVNVGPGVFTEDVIVNKEVRIAGQGAGVTTVYPATSNPIGAGGTLGGTNIFLVQASNVTIDNLTADGDNPANGAGIDARNGIVTDFNTGDHTNLEVHHTTVQNIFFRGIYSAYGNNFGSTFNFHHNTVNNVQGVGIFNYGNSGIIANNTVSNTADAIATNHSTGTIISNNTVSGSGIHTDNNGGGGGTADEIRGNTVSDIDGGGYGIMVFLPFRDVIVDQNIITNADIAIGNFGQGSAVTPVFSRNTIDGLSKVNSTGVLQATSYPGFGSSNVAGSYINNFIRNNQQGFYFKHEAGRTSNVGAHENSITGNTTTAVIGVGPDGAGSFINDFTCNWYGGDDPVVTGGSITYQPILNSGTDNDGDASNGFQPVPGSCVMCGSDTEDPVIVVKSDPVIHLGPSGQYTLQASDVIQSLTDNCDADPDIQFSRSSFNCADINAGAGESFEAYSTTTNTGNQAWKGEMGMEFQVNIPEGISIKQLGVFDHGGNGINGAISGGIRVAVFNTSTQSIVPGLDVNISGTADGYTGNHRMKNITPVVLPPGNYVVVAKGYNSGEFNGNRIAPGLPVNGTDLNDGNGAITFVRSRYSDDNPAGFNYPTYSYEPSPNVFLAGTFLFEKVVTGTAKVTVTITATDSRGNSAQADVEVTVEDPNNYCAGDPCAGDNQAPAIVSKNVTVQLDVNGQATIQPSDVIQTLTDNCDATPNVQLSRSSFTCADINLGSGDNFQAYSTIATTGNQAFQGEMGMEFQVIAPQGITIKQLGAFDHQGNGITGSISGGVRVAIFDNATHTIIPGLDVNISGNGDAFTGSHRMKNITPVILLPGNYVLVAKGYHGGEMNGNRIQPGIPVNANDLNTGNGAISFTRSKYSDDNPGGFNYPSYNYDPSPNVFLAGTFQFEGEASGAGNVIVTITATDDAGNVTQKDVTVTIEDPDGNCSGDPCASDNKAPVIVSKNVTIQLDINGQASIQPSDVIQSLTDNCDGNPDVQLSRSSFSCADVNVGSGEAYQSYATTTTSGNQAFSGEMGMEFQVNAPQGITIKQLGAFDHQANGINGTISGGVRVAIFDAATHAIVPGLDVNIMGNADAYTGNHRMKNITPVILPPGNYVIVAKGYHGGEMNGNRIQPGIPVNAGDLNTGNGAISFIRSKYSEDNPNGFNYPAYNYDPSPNVFLAGTFQFEGEASGTGSVTVTITATDDAGNISQKNVTVTVEDPDGNCSGDPCANDTKAPVIVAKNVSVQLDVNGQATIQPSDVIQSLTDNCDANPNVQLSRNTFSCADINAGGGDTYQAYSTTATSGNQAFTGEMGMEFQVVGPQGITIKQLGAFDHNGDGIIGSIAGGVRVAIFDAATQSIVPGLDVNISGNSDAYTGSHRMKDIAPVILPPGNYVLVAKGYHSGEMNGNRVQHGIPVNAGDLNNGNGAISFVRSKYGQDNPSGFNYPAIDYNPSPNVFLAGTFLFEDEPSGAGSVTVTITATDDAGNISQKNATVTVEDPNGNCAAPVTRKSDMQASILPGSQAGMRMKVFPNPASRHFNVQLNNLNAPRVTIQVIALGGKVVEQKQVTLSGKTASVMVPFNMQTPTAGLYIIRVITDTEVYTQKLVIQQ